MATARMEPGLAHARSTSLTRAWWTLGVLTAAYILSFVDRLIVTVVVEPLKSDLVLSDVQISLLQGAAFAVFYAIMGVPLGRLADISNRRVLIAVGILLWSVATVLCGLSTTFGAIFAARVLVGVGEAVLSPAAFSMFADLFPKDRLARAIGIFTTGGAVGNGIALLAGGALLNAFTARGSVEWPLLGSLAPWQSTFVVVGLPGLLIAALVAMTIREPRRVSARSSPPVRLVWNRLSTERAAYLPVMVAWALNAIVAYSYVSWAPVFLSRTFGLAPGDAGIAFGSVMLICGIVGPVLGGWICDRLSRAGCDDAPLRVSQWGFVALTVLGAVTFNLPTLPLTLGAMALLTLGFTALLTQGPVAVQYLTPANMRGQMSGVNLMVGNLAGLGLGPLLAAASAAAFFDGRLGPGIAITIIGAASCGTWIAYRGRRALATAIRLQRGVPAPAAA